MDYTSGTPSVHRIKKFPKKGVNVEDSPLAEENRIGLLKQRESGERSKFLAGIGEIRDIGEIGDIGDIGEIGDIGGIGDRHI